VHALRYLRPLHAVNRLPMPPPVARRLKRRAESMFWRVELERYVDWYRGSELRGVPPPAPEARVTGHDERTNAALTRLRVFTDHYARELGLTSSSLSGMRALDVGCGPFPALMAFDECDRHGLDPLVGRYREAGFPIEEFERLGYRYHEGFAEDMPFEDASFDAIVSANALDHVDDLGAVAHEIRRIARPGALVRLRVEYHERPTITEPIAMTDDVMGRHFPWLERLREGLWGTAAGR
jgi:SAM-dependent methyltransferase